MCLITFAWNTHPVYKLIVAANRDEFYARPTAALDYWSDHPGILGGRDLKDGGTWMGMHTSGRFTAITNYRDLSNLKTEAPSRGKLTRDFLTGMNSSRDFFESVRSQLDLFNGFNLLTLEGEKLFYFNNIQKQLLELSPGIYGLSNSFLDTPWPKVEKAKAFFAKSISKEEIDLDEILEWMGNNETAPDDQLPGTGLPLDLERKLSAMCIVTEDYGTCCTSVVTITHSGEVNYSETTYARGGRKEGLVNLKLQLQ